MTIATATAQADAITIATTAVLTTATGDTVSYGQACSSITGSGLSHFTFAFHPLAVATCQSLCLSLAESKSQNRRMEPQFMANFPQTFTLCSHGCDGFDSNTRFKGCQCLSF